MKTTHTPMQDKIEAKKEQIVAKINQLKAQMKEAGADARIALERKIRELENSM